MTDVCFSKRENSNLSPGFSSQLLVYFECAVVVQFRENKTGTISYEKLRFNNVLYNTVVSVMFSWNKFKHLCLHNIVC